MNHRLEGHGKGKYRQQDEGEDGESILFNRRKMDQSERRTQVHLVSINLKNPNISSDLLFQSFYFVL